MTMIKNIYELYNEDENIFYGDFNFYKNYYKFIFIGVLLIIL